MGLVGAMITEYPAEERRYDGAEYEPFWAAAQDLNMPLSLHTATARKGPNRAAGPTSVRTASGRANKVFLPATSLCDMIFSGVFERYPRLNVAVVEFELAWAPHLLGTMDYTYIERQKEASYRFKGDVLPSDFFHRNVYLSFQEDGIGIRMRDVIGVDRLMWGRTIPTPNRPFPSPAKSWKASWRVSRRKKKRRSLGLRRRDSTGSTPRASSRSDVLFHCPPNPPPVVGIPDPPNPLQDALPWLLSCSPTGFPPTWSVHPHPCVNVKIDIVNSNILYYRQPPENQVPSVYVVPNIPPLAVSFISEGLPVQSDIWWEDLKLRLKIVTLRNQFLIRGC